MIEILYWLLVGWLLNRALVAASRNNYTSPYNGYGAVDEALARTAQAPMVYRVLVPWMMVILRRFRVGKIESYEISKLLLISGALYSTRLAWGWEVATLTAAILPATFLYDYWDWAAELIGINLALTGSIPLAWVGMVLWGLSRETAVLSGLAFAFVSGDAEMGALLVLGAGAIYIFLRIVQGKHDLYCDRVMLKTNLLQLRYFYRCRPAMMYGEAISITWVGLGLVGGLMNGWTGILPLVLAGAGLVMGRVDETRIFSGMAPWIAAGLLAVIGG